MAFLRLTRDRRGYENTFLLHSARPGERPTVLYWYRSAPGVRVGRPALDEDAIRTIEEEHPEIDFDWPHILEVGAIIEPEIERRPLKPKRRPMAPVTKPPAAAAPPREGITEAADEATPDTKRMPADEVAQPGEASDVGEGAPSSADSDAALLADTAAAVDDQDEFGDAKGGEGSRPARPRPHDLLDELVGHEIATRLHARYSEIISRVHRIPESHPQRPSWEARAEALNPDNWVTPAEVLRAVSHADALFDSLRKELLAH